MGREWDPEVVKEQLDLELHPVEGMAQLTSAQLAEHDLEELAAISVRALGHLVQFSENENMRYKAATYVLDRVLGRASDTPMGGKKEEDQLRDLVNSAVTYG